MTIKLFQFGQIWGLPDASPFCMKVHSYLTITKTPFETEPFAVANMKKAPKGKFPYVILDGGEVVADSNMIIQRLIAEGKPDLDALLSQEQKAVSLAFRRTLDENLYWVLLFSRWIDEGGWPTLKAKLFGMIPPILRDFIANKQRKHIIKSAIGHGMARHSRDEVYSIGARDLQALSDFLYDKEMFFGTPEPTLLDVCVHAYTANILRVPIDSPLKTALKSHQNLVEHVARMDAVLGLPTG